jgi:hypothetical protein
VDEATRSAEHEAEAAARAVTREETRGSAALWFGVLGSPAAWAGHLVVNYALEEWFACSPSAQEPGRILGMPLGTFSIAFNSAMLALAVLAGLVALACLLGRKDGDGERMERARWMAFAGVVEGALFTAIILLGYAPALMLGVCNTTP